MIGRLRINDIQAQNSNAFLRRKELGKTSGLKTTQQQSVVQSVSQLVSQSVKRRFKPFALILFDTATVEYLCLNIHWTGLDNANVSLGYHTVLSLFPFFFLFFFLTISF